MQELDRGGAYFQGGYDIYIYIYIYIYIFVDHCLPTKVFIGKLLAM